MTMPPPVALVPLPTGEKRYIETSTVQSRSTNGPIYSCSDHKDPRAIGLHNSSPTIAVRQAN